MISYAPLLARVGVVQWTPDLIWFDSHQVMFSPNYYTYQMFSNYIGNKYLFSELDASINLHHSVTIDENKKEIYIKVVNVEDEPTTLEIKFKQFETLTSQAEYIVLTHEHLHAVNTFEAPLNVSPQTSILEVNEDDATIEVPQHSAVLLRLGYDDSASIAGVLPTSQTNPKSSSIPNVILVAGSVITVVLITQIGLALNNKKTKSRGI